MSVHTKALIKSQEHKKSKRTNQTDNSGPFFYVLCIYIYIYIPKMRFNLLLDGWVGQCAKERARALGWQRIYNKMFMFRQIEKGSFAAQGSNQEAAFWYVDVERSIEA
ncbi:hypothetical protein P175DRAFT_0263292 [Aspergillus ochraceoroseus IBT 24754]|uniref:Uncharacterized protein n=1 Tax=Aspergillus ochraceoroseus IBT 24754 TaxID=1392256 RepID=A0A2T5LUP3_9EURO|nr:uncharacterized protein P175DRAFT_0263292 [Aspergillus ochraceoroseus IBT 24754]PTU20011.1 hypothetical protein P175DRAFT_0263292 [Aspergillus ochraceoroseus IBT 24754]